MASLQSINDAIRLKLIDILGEEFGLFLLTIPPQADKPNAWFKFDPNPPTPLFNNDTTNQAGVLYINIYDDKNNPQRMYLNVGKVIEELHGFCGELPHTIPDDPDFPNIITTKVTVVRSTVNNTTQALDTNQGVIFSALTIEVEYF